MPSERSTGSDCGLLERSRSSRAMPSGPPGTPPVVAHAAPNARAQKLTARIVFLMGLLPIGIQHVFEAHPLRIEIEIDVAYVAVTVLSHQELRRAFDVTRAVVHAFAIQREHDVRMVLHRAERAEIVELRTPIRTGGQRWQLGRRQYGDARVQCQ